MYPNRVYAKIDLSAIRANVDAMKAAAGDTAIYAVIKANGYGHGAVTVAKALTGHTEGFCVATAEEALELRAAGIEEPVLILGYVFPECNEQLILHDIMLTVFDYESAVHLSSAATKLGKKAKIHIKLDTGMSRLGFMPNSESIAEVCRIAALSGIVIEGMFSHFACADERDKNSAMAQLATFNKFADALQAKGVNIPTLHLSNSAAIIDLPEARFNMVRCGISTYGLYPSDEVDRSAVPLTPAMSIYSHIASLKTVAAGTPVSYGSTFVTQRETRIATVPVGYADGYPRSLSNKGYMLVRGKKAPVLGRVCMDQLMIDVTDIEDVSRGDKVVVMGEGVDADTLSRLSGRLHYELICDINPRVPRVYVGKNE